MLNIFFLNMSALMLLGLKSPVKYPISQYFSISLRNIKVLLFPMMSHKSLPWSRIHERDECIRKKLYIGDNKVTVGCRWDKRLI